MNSKNEKVVILRVRQVSRVVGFSVSQVWRLSSAGKFPQPIKMTGRTTGWVEEEVDSWLREKINARNK